MVSITQNKKKKIAVIELEAHPHFVEFLSNLFIEEDLTFYFSYNFFKKQIENQFKLSGKIVIQGPEESLIDFIEKNLAIINKMDLIIISTATKSKEVFVNKKIEFNNNVLLNIHNINEWFSLSMLYAFKFYFRTACGRCKFKKILLIDKNGIYIKANLKIDKNIFLLKTIEAVKNCFKIYREKKQNRVILNKAKYLNVFHPAMKKELDGKYNLAKKHIITTLPYRYPLSYKVDLKDKGYLGIGILGKVKASKDYVGLIETLNKFSCKPKKLTLFFLGAYTSKTHKKEVEKLIKSISHNKVIIKEMPREKRLSQKEIDKQMEEVDIIISPVVMDGVDRKSKEIYGQTRVSGTDFDAIYYGKPLFVPCWYNPVPYLSDMYIHYDNYDHLNELINKYSDHNLLLENKQRVRMIQEKYTWEHIRNNFYDQIFTDE